jgi:hypothetical protein
MKWLCSVIEQRLWAAMWLLQHQNRFLEVADVSWGLPKQALLPYRKCSACPVAFPATRMRVQNAPVQRDLSAGRLPGLLGRNNTVIEPASNPIHEIPHSHQSTCPSQ